MLLSGFTPYGYGAVYRSYPYVQAQQFPKLGQVTQPAAASWWSAIPGEWNAALYLRRYPYEQMQWRPVRRPVFQPAPTLVPMFPQMPQPVPSPVPWMQPVLYPLPPVLTRLPPPSVQQPQPSRWPYEQEFLKLGMVPIAGDATRFLPPVAYPVPPRWPYEPEAFRAALVAFAVESARFLAGAPYPAAARWPYEQMEPTVRPVITPPPSTLPPGAIPYQLYYRAVPYTLFVLRIPKAHLYLIAGITRDNTGVPLGLCVVKAYRTVDDVFVAQTLSDGTGNYTISVPSQAAHYLVAYLVGAPDVAGTTVNTLVGT